MSWMEQYTALQQWKTGLSIRTAFDPLHFVDEPFNWSSLEFGGSEKRNMGDDPRGGLYGQLSTDIPHFARDA